MIKFLLLINSGGKVRISKYYEHQLGLDMRQVESDVIKTCLKREKAAVRRRPESTILEYEDYTLVYKRFGNLIFIAGVSNSENELAILEFFQHIAETLNTYFGRVSELTIIYNLDKVYMILDEMILNGVIAETSRARILAPLRLMTSQKT